MTHTWQHSVGTHNDTYLTTLRAWVHIMTHTWQHLVGTHNDTYLTPSLWNGRRELTRLWSTWTRSAVGISLSGYTPFSCCWKAESMAWGRGAVLTCGLMARMADTEKFNHHCELLFCYYLPLEKDGAFHLNKLESPSSKDVLCQVCWNWPGGSGEEDVFWICYFVIISPWKRAGPSFEKKKLNPIHPRMLCAKFCWNWSVSLSTWRWKCEKFRQTDEQQVSFQLQCNKVNNFFIPNFWYSSNLKDHFLVTASVIFNMKHVIQI